MVHRISPFFHRFSSSSPFWFRKLWKKREEEKNLFPRQHTAVTTHLIIYNNIEGKRRRRRRRRRKKKVGGREIEYYTAPARALSLSSLSRHYDCVMTGRKTRKHIRDYLKDFFHSLLLFFYRYEFYRHKTDTLRETISSGPSNGWMD